MSKDRNREAFIQRCKAEIQAEGPLLLSYVYDSGSSNPAARFSLPGSPNWPRVAVFVCRANGWFGWSSCRPGDRFDRHIGTWKALQMAMKPECQAPPPKLRGVFEDFVVTRAIPWLQRREAARQAQIASS